MNNSFNKFDKIPVCAFEHYHLNDDCDNYPGIFYTRVTLTGCFNHQQFELSVYKALQRSKLLRSALEGDAHGKLNNIFWTDANFEPFIQWVKNEEPYTYPDPSKVGFDLTKEYGFRLFLREQQQQQTILLLQSHHACVDATGARMFIEDIFAYYDQQLDGDTDQNKKLRKLSQASLLSRDDFHQTPESLTKRKLIDFKYTFKALSFQPQAFYGGATTIKEGPIEAPSSVWHEFSAEEFKAIKSASKKHKGTINDFLLWSLFLSLDEWNRKHHPKGKSSPIRIGIAVNMRQPADDVIPPANVVSMYFLDRKGKIFSTPNALFGSVVEETQNVKRNLMGLAFIRTLSLLGRMNGGIQQLLKPRPLLSKCMVTTNLSNLGLPFADSPLLNADGKVQVADLIVERIELFPPIRSYTHGSFGVVSYDGRMTITFNFDPRTLLQQQGEDILRIFTDRIYQESSKT